jgi:amino acid transporter
MHVGVGGEYYMISRSLGLELGGAIGIPLYLCRTLSITFYSFGLAEAIAMFWPATSGEIQSHHIQLIAAIVIIIITIISGKSASLALKLQIPIMITVGVSLIALMIGVFTGGFRSPEMTATYRTAPEGFWYVFAVFFPAVTGFTAGIGMSGDLKEPRKAIPRGTIMAVVTGAVIYLSVPVLLAISAKVSPSQLASLGVETWTKVAILGAWLVIPGIFGAILSSAFGSVLGGPRVLQSLAQDKLAPRFLAKLSPTGQPTVSTWISGAIALAAVGLGGLNTVAQFVTILFLTLYILINFSAALENLTGDTSFRPKIIVPWYISLLGSFGAISVMFLISPLACVLGIILEIIIFIILRKRSMEKEWGDVRAGFWGTLARFALFKLKSHKSDPRNWRPHILVFSGDVEKRLPLVQLASLMNQNRGIMTVCKLIVGNQKEFLSEIASEKDEMDEILNRSGLIAFSEVYVVPEFDSGVINVTQANGIAGLNSNTVVFGWSEKKKRMVSLLKIIRTVNEIRRSAILVRIKDFSLHKERKQIDIWWRGKHSNGDMMLLLAYLLSLNSMWKSAKIVIYTIIIGEKDKAFVRGLIQDMIKEVRIKAEAKIIIKPRGQTIDQIILQNSRNSDVVFMGLNIAKPGEEKQYVERLDELSKGLKTTIFVRNGETFAGELI